MTTLQHLLQLEGPAADLLGLLQGPNMAGLAHVSRDASVVCRGLDASARVAAETASVQAHEAAYPDVPSAFTQQCLDRVAVTAWITSGRLLPAGNVDDMVRLVEALESDPDVAAYLAVRPALQQATAAVKAATPGLEEARELQARLASTTPLLTASAEPAEPRLVASRLDGMCQMAAYVEAVMRWCSQVLIPVIDDLVLQPLTGRLRLADLNPPPPREWQGEPTYAALGGPVPVALLAIIPRLFDAPQYRTVQLMMQHSTPAGRGAALQVALRNPAWPENDPDRLVQAPTVATRGTSATGTRYHPYWATTRQASRDPKTRALNILRRLAEAPWQVATRLLQVNTPQLVVYLCRAAAIAGPHMEARLSPGARALFSPLQWRQMRRDLHVGPLIRTLNAASPAVQEVLNRRLLYLLHVAHRAPLPLVPMTDSVWRRAVPPAEAQRMSPAAAQALQADLTPVLAALHHTMTRFVKGWGVAA